MNTARVQGSAAFAATPIVVRTINVHQNLMPGPGRSRGTTVSLGEGWAAAPKSLIVDGKSLNVAGRPGASGAVFTVTVPVLSDGLHSATVKLANGVEVKVVLNVRSVHD